MVENRHYVVYVYITGPKGHFYRGGDQGEYVNNVLKASMQYFMFKIYIFFIFKK